MDVKTLKPVPPKLPEKIEDWQRNTEFKRTLNDQVEEIHRHLWDESVQYREYLEAVWDEQAVEGSLAADNIKAAELVRDLARDTESRFKNNDVGRQKLATLAKVLGIILRRYNNTRKQRRNTVAGEIVPNGDGD